MSLCWAGSPKCEPYLAAVSSDGLGNIDAKVLIPSSLQPGQFVIVAEGPGNPPVVETQSIQITANPTDSYSFTAGGGSGSPPASGSGLDGTTITLPADTFTRAGYTFAGWSDETTTYATGATYTLSSGGVAIVFTAQWTPTTSTAVLIPSKGATLSGSTFLDASASNATSVNFLLFGGTYGYAAPVICTATVTYYGWVCAWNTTTVSNGAYTVVSEASGPGGSTFSSGVRITVNNPLPATSILIPSGATTLSGSTYLDASASNATSVEFLLFGGTYGFAAPVVCTGRPTPYGWLCAWNTSTVPDGSYTLLSEAFNSAGSTFSGSGVRIMVNN